jgi:hypothetical protein
LKHIAHFSFEKVKIHVHYRSEKIKFENKNHKTQNNKLTETIVCCISTNKRQETIVCWSMWQRKPAHTSAEKKRERKIEAHLVLTKKSNENRMKRFRYSYAFEYCTSLPCNAGGILLFEANTKQTLVINCQNTLVTRERSRYWPSESCHPSGSYMIFNDHLVHILKRKSWRSRDSYSHTLKRKSWRSRDFNSIVLTERFQDYM